MVTDSIKVWESERKRIFASIHKLKSKSENAKTGDMTGLYVLPLEESPTQSIKYKRDSMQCGDCPLKASVGGACYVNPVSTNSPWRAKVGADVSPLPDSFDKPVRFGVYGDPGLVPLSLIRKIANKAPKRTGYTHQWHRIKRGFAKYLMASIDNAMAKALDVEAIELKRMANRKGYRTFRVITEGQEIDSDEIQCPNDTHGVQCADCGLCDGNEKGSKKNIYIHIHGPQNKVKAYQRASK